LDRWNPIPNSGGNKMNENKLMMMNVIASILSSYYANKVSFCILNNREPNDAEKDDLLKRVLSMFENLSTSYLGDIQEIAETIK
jgi:hypothetical protein